MNLRVPPVALVAVAIFLLNVALNAALFLPGESKYRDSIEGGYASMAVFFASHPNPFGWNPLQYGGMPAQFWYLPGIPYVSALAINLLPFLKPEHVYRLVTVSLACLSPVTLFLFVYYFTRSRAWALVAALGFTFISPSYLVYPDIARDRGITYLPWRMQVLVKYGEGPHNAGLTLLPLALIACWRAAITRGFGSLFVAAVLMAAITLTNWVAAVALAWCVLMMMLAGVGTAPLTGFLARRLWLAAGLAYLLACFWLTPRFIQTTLFNWPVDAFGYKLQTAQYLLLLALAALPLAVRLVFLRFPRQHYFSFLLLCFAGFLLVVSGHYWLRADTIPESRRYALEAEMFFFCVVAEAGRRLSALGSRVMRDVAVAGVTAVAAYGSFQAHAYIVHTWILMRPSPRELHPEFRVARLLNERSTEGRVYVSGGTRFRLNSWFAVPQLGGTFESGLENRAVLPVIYHVMTGRQSPLEHRVRDAVWLLRAMGVEYFAVHGAKSREHWRDINHPWLFRQELTPVWEEGDDAVYQLPFRSLANLVSPEELPRALPTGANVPLIEPFIRALDDESRPRARLRRISNSEFEVESAAPGGLWLNVAVSHHPGWRVTQDGQPVEVQASVLGQMVVKPRPAASSTFRFRYLPSWQQVVGSAVSLLAWVVSLAVLWRGRR
jgi:hypothetical protein